MIASRALITLCLLMLCSAARPAPAAPPTRPSGSRKPGADVHVVSFQHDILPLFRAACVGCHGDSNPTAKLSLTSYAALRKGGAGGAEIVPGRSGDSRLYGYLTGTIKPVMPLGGALKPDEIARVRRWIDTGAHDDSQRTENGKTEPTPVMPMIAAPMPVTALAFSPDGKTLAIGLYRQVEFWDVATARPARIWSGHAGAVHSLVFSRDGNWLAAGGGDPGVSGEARIWDIKAAHETRTLRGHTDVVNAVAFSPDGKRLATGSMDRTIKIWDLSTGRATATLADHSDAVTGLAYSPDSRYLVSGSLDRSLKVWDAGTGKRLYTIEAHDDGITGVEFSPDGKSLLSSSADRSAHLWTFGNDNSVLAANLTGHDEAVLAAAFAPDGKSLATASADRTVRLWTLSGGSTHTLTGAQDWIYSVGFSPDGKTVAAGTWDGLVLLWNAADGKPAGSLSAAPVTAPHPVSATAR